MQLMKYVFATLTLVFMTGCDVTINLVDQEKWGTEAMARSIIAHEVKSEPATPVTPDVPSVKVARKDCKECKGTGRVKTGDGISWTVCDNCEPPAASGGLVVRVLPEAKRYKDKWGQIWWSRDGVKFYSSEYCIGEAKTYPPAAKSQSQPVTQFQQSRVFASGSCSTCR